MPDAPTPTVDDLLALSRRQLGREPEIRDRGLLESAAGRPTVTVFGEDAYPGPYEKAAGLLHSIVRNHPLIDGNKRLGFGGAALLLKMQGVDTLLSEDDRFELTMVIALGELDDIGTIAGRLRPPQER